MLRDGRALRNIDCSAVLRWGEGKYYSILKIFEVWPDLFLHVEAVVPADCPALPVLHSPTLESLHLPAVLPALRLTEAHQGVVRLQLPHQRAVA